MFFLSVSLPSCSHVFTLIYKFLHLCIELREICFVLKNCLYLFSSSSVFECRFCLLLVELKHRDIQQGIVLCMISVEHAVMGK